MSNGARLSLDGTEESHDPMSDTTTAEAQARAKAHEVLAESKAIELCGILPDAHTLACQRATALVATYERTLAEARENYAAMVNSERLAWARTADLAERFASMTVERDEAVARLGDAAQSLETCANWKRQETDIRDAFFDLRGYANSRATAARAALAGMTETPKGETP